MMVSVTEPKLVLVTAQQANKLRDELLGQGMVNLSGKLADGEDGRLGSQRTVFPELRIQSSFMLKGEGIWLAAAHFLVLENFVPTALHIGLVTVFYKPPRQILFSVL